MKKKTKQKIEEAEEIIDSLFSILEKSINLNKKMLWEMKINIYITIIFVMLFFTYGLLLGVNL